MGRPCNRLLPLRPTGKELSMANLASHPICNIVSADRARSSYRDDEPPRRMSNCCQGDDERFARNRRENPSMTHSPHNAPITQGCGALAAMTPLILAIHAVRFMSASLPSGLNQPYRGRQPPFGRPSPTDQRPERPRIGSGRTQRSVRDPMT